MPDNRFDKARPASLDWRAKEGNDPPKISIPVYKRVRIRMRSPLDAEDAESKSGDNYKISPHHSDHKSQHQVPQQQVAALVYYEPA